MLEKVLPLLPSILGQWVGDKCVVEAVCDMIKKAVRTLMDQFAPLVADTITLITQMYCAHPNAALLDLAKQVYIDVHIVVCFT